jgi:uncharacterized protein
MKAVTENFSPNLMLILPVGTQVVTRVAITNLAGDVVCPRGAVGMIMKAPVDGTHYYRVRFHNGIEAPLHRHQLTIRKQFQGEGLKSHDAFTDSSLWDFVIYRCVVGSRAFGLETEDSDTDRRGIYLPPADMYWSLYGVPEQLENSTTQECYWELRKFLILALKANPNILECLYTAQVEMATPLVLELLDMREAFLSRLVYQTYNGYVISQFKKLEQDLRSTGAIKWKHAVHLIRLLISGITVLREGHIPVNVGNHRDLLLSIKRGELSWDDVNRLRLNLHQDFDRALASTSLPERPDYLRVNRFLIKARCSRVSVLTVNFHKDRRE